MANLLRSCIWSHHLQYASLIRSSLTSRNLFVSAALKQDQVQPKPIPPATESTTSSSAVGSSSAHSLHSQHKPTDMEKKLLVWTKKYKKVEDIPEVVSREEMEKCRSRVRIKISNILMGLTVVGCIIMIISGKRAAERGETIQKMNLDFHNQYNKEAATKTSTPADGSPLSK